MRKFICILLVICIIPFCFILGNAAETSFEDGPSYFDVLSYTGISNSSSNLITFNLPSTVDMYYIDVIFAANRFSSILYGFDGSRETQLTFVSLGKDSAGVDMYRAFGTVGISANRFSLRVNRSDTWVYFYRLHIYNTTTIQNAIDGGCTIVAPGFSGTSIDYDPDDSTNRREWTGSDYSGQQLVNLSLHSDADNWKGYDYIDFLVSLTLNDITSISCYFLGVSVPFEVSYLNSSYNSSDRYLLNIRIDVRGLDRTSNTYPIVSIIGHEVPLASNVVDIWHIEGITFLDNKFTFNYFFTRIWSSLTSGFNSLSSGIGSISTWIQTQTTSLVNAISSGIDSVGTWIQNQTITIVNNLISLKTSLTSWFSTLFSDLADIKDSLSGSVEDGEQIQDNIDNSKQEMDDYKNAMESLPIPDIGDVDLDLDDNSGNAAITSVGRVLAIGINNDVTLPIFMLLFTFAMVGYALYGKR